MKKSILTALFLVIVCLTIQAQKTPFIRIYNLNGIKIMKGKLVNLTDSGLTVLSKGTNYQIPYQDIGIIKNRKSLGFGALIGTTVSTATFLVLAANADNGFFDKLNYQAWAVITAPFAAAAGMEIASLSPRSTFIVNANKEFWLKTKVELEKLRM